MDGIDEMDDMEQMDSGILQPVSCAANSVLDLGGVCGRIGVSPREMPRTVISTGNRKQRRRTRFQSEPSLGRPLKSAPLSPPQPPGGRLARLLPWAAMALAALVFVGTLRYQFVYDDLDQIVGNQTLASWRYLPAYFEHDIWNRPGKESISNYYRPLFSVWLRANEQWFGEKPAGWHAIVILLHALVTLLVYLVAARLLKDQVAAGFAAVLFAVHPLHVECVAWISGVTEPEFAFFLLLSIWCYLRWGETGARKWLAGSLAAFALSLLSKETAIVLCGLIFYLEWQRAQPSRLKRSLVATLPFGVLALLYLWARSAALHGLAPTEINQASLGSILLTQPTILWFYLRKMLWPLPMSVFYPVRFVSEPGPTNFLAPLLASLAVLAGLWLWLRRRPAVAMATAFLLLPLIPPLIGISSFNPFDLVHDRYLYLPSVGLVILMALALRHLKPGGWKLGAVPILQLGILVALTAALSAVTVQQAGYWTSNRVLFTHGVEVAPRSPLALLHLAKEEEQDQNLGALLRLCERALQEDPNHYATLIRVGNLRWTFHDYDGAMVPLLRARQLHPERRAAHFWLGVVYLEKARYSEAETEFRQAIEAEPNEPNQHVSLGMALEDQGRYEEAIKEYQAELQINPASEQARQRLAVLKGGRFSRE